MSNNIKRAIKARKKKYGESHSTARMHVVGAPPSGPSGPSSASTEPPKLMLGEWTTDRTPRLPPGVLARFLAGDAPEGIDSKLVIVVPAGGRWLVILAPGMPENPIQGSFAAPDARTACLYADDYLHAHGYSGPGVGPLPPVYPALRQREDASVPSKHERFVLEQGAKCACGHVGLSIRDRHEPCPACGGIALIMAETLARYLAPIDGTVSPPTVRLSVRAFSRRWGRAETLTFSRTPDGWSVSNGAHTHPVRPNGDLWGRGRPAGHRGLHFFIVNEDYRVDEGGVADTLNEVWRGRISEVEGQRRLEGLFA